MHGDFIYPARSGDRRQWAGWGERLRFRYEKSISSSWSIDAYECVNELGHHMFGYGFVIYDV